MIRLLFLSFLLVGCGSKKKTIDKLEIETKTETFNNIKAKEVENITLETSSTLNLSSFFGRVGDSSKIATITETNKDGQRIITFTNFKDVQASKLNEVSTNTTKTEKVQETQDKSVKKEVIQVDGKY